MMPTIFDPYEPLLQRVEKPARYAGGELNTYKKDWEKAKARMVLAFPDLYEIGFSHLGLRLLYHRINEDQRFLAERVYAPAEDMESELRAAGLPLFTLESRRPVADFDLLGFTLQYELSYTNILNMMKMSGIPLRREDRGEKYPLLIGGGPGSFNPEPLADFFDLFLLGEGEEAVIEILEVVAEGKSLQKSKSEIKRELLRVPGVYLPEYYRVTYEPDGRIASIRPLAGAPEKVYKRVLKDFNVSYLPKTEIIPWIEPVHDRLMLEILRGCSRGCRFCQAGMIYRPVRERNRRLIEESLAGLLARTGYEEVSLTSLSSADHSEIREMLAALTECYSPKGVNISLPSTRIDAFSPDLAASFQGGRKASLTFAPEAGTDRLRAVINKNLSHAEIMSAARSAFQAGWRKLKLYFMIGLPTETDEDLEGIIALAQEVLQAGRETQRKRAGQVRVTVSVSTFVPKPHTPFQWRPQITLEETVRKQEFLKAGLVGKGLEFSWHEALLSQMEGVFSRGDRRLGKVLEEAAALGCKFDAWPDKFHWDRWQEAFAACALDPLFYTARRRSYDEVLPWSHLSPGLEAKYLEEEDRRAEKAVVTEDCRTGRCPGCGVCPRLEVKPEIAGGEKDL